MTHEEAVEFIRNYIDPEDTIFFDARPLFGIRGYYRVIFLCEEGTISMVDLTPYVACVIDKPLACGEILIRTPYQKTCRRYIDIVGRAVHGEGHKVLAEKF